MLPVILVTGGNLAFGMSDGEIINQHPVWEILWKMLWEILWEMLQEILQDRVEEKSLFKKISDWWKFSIWNRVVGS